MFLSRPVNLELFPDPYRASRLLHRALLGGLVVIPAVFVVLGVMGVAPLISGGEGVLIIGYGLAGVSMLQLIVGMLVFRPRVPTRSSSRSDAEFWQGALGPAVHVWSLFEAGGITSALGALMTGLVAPMVVVVAALACLAFVGPSYFEHS